MTKLIGSRGKRIQRKKKHGILFGLSGKMLVTTLVVMALTFGAVLVFATETVESRGFVVESVSGSDATLTN